MVTEVKFFVAPATNIGQGAKIPERKILVAYRGTPRSKNRNGASKQWGIANDVLGNLSPSEQRKVKALRLELAGYRDDLNQTNRELKELSGQSGSLARAKYQEKRFSKKLTRFALRSVIADIKRAASMLNVPGKGNIYPEYFRFTPYTYDGEGRVKDEQSDLRAAIESGKLSAEGYTNYPPSWIFAADKSQVAYRAAKGSDEAQTEIMKPGYKPTVDILAMIKRQGPFKPSDN